MVVPFLFVLLLLLLLLLLLSSSTSSAPLPPFYLPSSFTFKSILLSPSRER